MSKNIIMINSIATLGVVADENRDNRVWGLGEDVKSAIKNINAEAEAEYYSALAKLEWSDVSEFIAVDAGWTRTNVVWKSDKGDVHKNKYWHVTSTNVKWEFSKYVEYSLVKGDKIEALKVLYDMHMLCTAIHMGDLNIKDGAKMWHSLCQEMSEVTNIPLTQYNLNRKSVLRELSAHILRFTDEAAKIQSASTFCKELSVFVRRSIKGHIDEDLNMSGEYSKLYREMVNNVKSLGGEPTNMLSEIDTEATA